VRTESPDDRVMNAAAGGVVCAGATLLGGIVGGVPGALGGAALGGLAGYLLASRTGHRLRRRETLTAEPFPETWRLLLQADYDHYRRLPASWRERFESDVRIFVAEKRITGVELEVTDELRLLVAASAVTLSVGWPRFEWEQLSEVLLYPQSFDRDYAFGGPTLGEAHPWGTIILSVPSLKESFLDGDDAYHVGLHEFAHLLDMEHASFDGVPAGLPEDLAETWVDIRDEEMSKLRSGWSDLDPYGAHDPAEFFAVAVEAFFEIPLDLREDHEELYGFLARYFGQDPASWDEQRSRGK
jgi:Mlc titration factor MtfA (ptsG expression regulator)